MPRQPVVFRRADKIRFTVKLPLALEEAIRERSRISGDTMSALATLSLCRDYGFDPEVFGLKPIQQEQTVTA